MNFRNRAHGAWVDATGMASFGLWAPHVEHVDLQLDGGSTPMLAAGDGWWQLGAAAAHGDRYAYRLDGGDTLPDPAARWLPDGVHAPSALVDPSRWTWSDRSFQATPVTGAVIYEMHIGTFSGAGTFRAAIDHLGPLVDLGVTHVEVMPINAFDGHHGWGYDGVAWWAVHQPYGGPDGLAEFVDACHARGLAVILDVVHNHLGPSGNYLPRFGPYLQADAESTWGKVVNLDGAGSGPVRDFLVGNALSWLRDYHIDALRLDAVHALDDRGSATHILAEIVDAVADLGEQTGRHLELIAETDRNDPRTIQPRVTGGMGLDAQWADGLHHAIHVSVTGETDGYYVDFADPIPALADAYVHGLVYDGSRLSAFRDRYVGAPLPDDTSSRRLVGCIQNHDQVGNRAAGDRLTTLVDPHLVRLATLLLCTAPHTPMLFMGEEYGETQPFQFFSDMPGEELRSGIRDGRRREFESFTRWQGEVPDPLDPATFSRSHLDWSSADTGAARMRRALWTDLLALRRTQPALGTGDRRLIAVTTGDQTLTVHRQPPSTAPLAFPITILANFGDAPLPSPSGHLLLASDDVRYGGDRSPDERRVQPGTAVIHLIDDSS